MNFPKTFAADLAFALAVVSPDELEPGPQGRQQGFTGRYALRQVSSLGASSLGERI